MQQVEFKEGTGGTAVINKTSLAPCYEGQNLMAQFGLGIHPKPINCGQVGFVSQEATPNGSYYSGQIAL